MTEEEAEEAAGFERHHAAELEEEGRRHAAMDGESEVARGEEVDQQDAIDRINWDEERKKRGRQRDEDDDETEDGEAAAAAAAEAQKKGFAGPDGAGKYFQDMPEDRMGDLALTDPNEMKRALGPSVRFAQHAMLLAEERRKAGNTRDDALAFLAALYAGVGDRQYANKALREYGHATGIIDLYPLEVMEHLLEHVPGFCTKVKKAQLFANSDGCYDTRVGTPIVLEYDAKLRMRGFAVKGGDCPGYLFEPIEPPGTYHLIFLSEGNFTVMLSAITRDGWLMLDELNVRVEAADDADLEAIQGLIREREHDAEVPKKAEKDKQDDLKIHFPKRI